MSSWHPLFQGSAAYAELAEELHGRGLEYVNTELPTATAFPDGTAMFLQTTLDANIAEFDRYAEGDGTAWQRQFEAFMEHADVSFGVLGTELWSSAGLGLGQRMLRRFGRRGLLDFAGHALATCRDWTTATFRSEEAHGLLAPWVLHTGLGPDNAVSGFMTQVIACAVQLGGMPVPVGGGVTLVDALAGIVRDEGRRRADRGLRRPCDGRRPRGRRVRRCRARRDRRRDADTALRRAAGVDPHPGGRPRRGRRVPLRPGGDADPHRDGRASPLEGARR
jgi:phytoene dehydrogenase-like protein